MIPALTLSLNWVAILGAAVLSMVLGFIWYAEPVFGKMWMQELKFKKSDLNPNPVIYLFSFIGAFIAAFVLANVMLLLKADSLAAGALTGLLFGLVVFWAMMAHFLFEKKSLRLLLIDGLYPVVWLVLTGAMFGSFLFR